MTDVDTRFVHTLEVPGEAWEWFIQALMPAVEQELVATVGDRFVWLEGWIGDPYSAAADEPILMVQPLHKDHSLDGLPLALTLLDLEHVRIQ